MDNPMLPGLGFVLRELWKEYGDSIVKTRHSRRRKRRRGGFPPQQRRNPWPRCQACHRRVPELCTNDDDGRICDRGVRCGCCPGHADQQQDRRAS
jgi:hypothetical protein